MKKLLSIFTLLSLVICSSANAKDTFVNYGDNSFMTSKMVYKYLEKECENITVNAGMVYWEVKNNDYSINHDEAYERVKNRFLPYKTGFAHHINKDVILQNAAFFQNYPDNNNMNYYKVHLDCTMDFYNYYLSSGLIYRK